MPDKPHSHLWHLLRRTGVRQELPLREEIVHIGFWSSIVFFLLIGLDVFTPELLYAHYVVIAIAYLTIQLIEIIARDPLDPWDAMKDDVFSLLPAIAGLILRILHARGSGLFTPDGVEVLDCFTWVAWIDFAFNILLATRVTVAPYERDETITGRSSR